MRVDVPTLRCDRCGIETQDTAAMAAHKTLTHHQMSGADRWDLCPSCWSDWRGFLRCE